MEQGHHVPKRSGPGDLVGEYEVLSGHPLPADCVGGPSGGVIGFLSLDLGEIRAAIQREREGAIAEEGARDAGGGDGVGDGVDAGRLAMKLLRSIGIAATSTDGLEAGADSSLNVLATLSTSKQVEPLYHPLAAP